VTQPDKDSPSPEWISSLRARFVTEREVDNALTRKLENRSGPGYQPVPLDELVDGVSALIRSNGDSSFEIADAYWLPGGASKLQMAFTVRWNQSDATSEPSRMVLRTETAESLHTTSRRREFELLSALNGVIPVPTAYWVDHDATHLPYPGLVTEFADGVSKPTDTQSGVSGLGTRLPPALREKLAPQFVERLARLHTFDFRAENLRTFDIPDAGRQNAIWAINWWDRVWEEDADEDVPLVALASAWLRKNAPAVDQLSVVHGDYRTGNYLFTEHDSRINAWLDWELARIGDRHQDLAWSTSNAFATYDENGRNLLVSGLLTEEEFFEAYERASGLSVDQKSVHYYKVFNAYAMVVMTLATSYRVARNGKSHQDVLLSWLLGVGYMLMDDMRRLIENGS